MEHLLTLLFHGGLSRHLSSLSTPISLKVLTLEMCCWCIQQGFSKSLYANKVPGIDFKGMCVFILRLHGESVPTRTPVLKICRSTANVDIISR